MNWFKRVWLNIKLFYYLMFNHEKAMALLAEQLQESIINSVYEGDK